MPSKWAPVSRMSTHTNASAYSIKVSDQCSRVTGTEPSTELNRHHPNQPSTGRRGRCSPSGLPRRAVLRSPHEPDCVVLDENEGTALPPLALLSIPFIQPALIDRHATADTEGFQVLLGDGEPLLI